MDFTVLSTKGEEEYPKYVGVNASHPGYIDGLDEEHPVNQAFLWYSAQRGTGSFIHNGDLARARELIQLYANLTPPRYYRLVEVTKNNQPPTTHCRFLGYDLAAGSYSLLSWGLEIGGDIPDYVPSNDLVRVMHPLFRLIQAYFQPQLNEYGLFSTYPSAHFCLDCMLALQVLRPGLWENDLVKFEVLGLWEILD